MSIGQAIRGLIKLKQINYRVLQWSQRMICSWMYDQFQKSFNLIAYNSVIMLFTKTQLVWKKASKRRASPIVSNRKINMQSRSLYCVFIVLAQ